MPNLQDLINLAKADGGKFFVMDESGDAKLVIMSVEDYQKLLLDKLQKQVRQQTEDIENINQIITKAQMQEVVGEPAYDVAARHGVPDQENGRPWPAATAKTIDIPTPKVLGPTIVEEKRSAIVRQDLREEVIDPSFDFEGPKMDIDDL